MPQIYLDIDATGAVRGIQQYETAAVKGAAATKQLTDGAVTDYRAMATEAARMAATVAAALTAVAAASVKTFASFDDQVRMAAATAGATAAEFEKLSAAAKEAGASTRYSASQSAEALTGLAQRGFDVVQAISAMPAVLDLAAANQLDLAAATGVATGVLKGFGKEVEGLVGVNDVLTATSQKSAANVLYLGEAFKYAAPAARGSKESIEEASAVIAGLADNAFAGGEAGNAYKRMLISLQAPTAGATAKLRELEIVTKDAKGNFIGLIPVLEQLQKKNIDLVDSFQIFGAYTATAALAAANSADKIAKLRKELEDVDGVARRTAEFQEAGVAGAFRTLKSATEAVAISIGESLAPAIRDAAKYLTSFARDTAALNSSSNILIESLRFISNGFLGIYISAQAANIAIGETAEQIYKVVDSVNDIAGFTGIAKMLGFDISLDSKIKEVEKFNKVQGDGIKNTLDLIDRLNLKYDEYKRSIKETRGEAENTTVSKVGEEFEIRAAKAAKAHRFIEDLAGKSTETQKLSAETITKSLAKTEQQAISTAQAVSAIGDASASVSVNFDTGALGDLSGQVENLKAKVESLQQDFVIKVNADPSEAIKFAEELDRIESKLANTERIDSYNQKIKELETQLKQTKTEFADGKLTIDTDQAATAAIEAQINALRQQRLAIDNLVPGLEIVNGVWQQIPATVAASSAQVAGSLASLVSESGYIETKWVEIDGVLTEVLQDGTVLVDGMTTALIKNAEAAGQFAEGLVVAGAASGTLSDTEKIIKSIRESLSVTADSAGLAGKKLAEMAASKAALSSISSEITILKQAIKDVGEESERGQELIKELFVAEQVKDTITKKISSLKKEIFETGKAAESTAEKISKIPAATAGAANSIESIATANTAVAETTNELAAAIDSVGQSVEKSSNTFVFRTYEDIDAINAKIESIRETEKAMKSFNDMLQSTGTVTYASADKDTMGQQRIRDLEMKKYELKMEKTLDNIFNKFDERAKESGRRLDSAFGAAGSPAALQQGAGQVSSIRLAGAGQPPAEQKIEMNFYGASREDAFDIQSQLKRNFERR